MRIKEILSVCLYAILTIIIEIIAVQSCFWAYKKATMYNVVADERDKLKYRAVIVTTPSMYPTIEVGSLSIVKSVNQEDIEVGDIILFRGKHDEVVAHRVIEIEEIDGRIFFVTKGDANRYPDGILIDNKRYIGKVTTTINWLAPVFRALFKLA